MKVYSADICIDCRNWQHIMALRGIEMEVVDITASTANLREFLHLRDTSPVFAACRERGGIGIPCFTDGDFITLSGNEALARLGQPPVLPEEVREHR